MSSFSTEKGIEHASTRIYIFNCTYPDDQTNWQVDPQPLIDLLRYKLDRLPDISYKTIKVCGVKKVLSSEMEIHIDTVEYFGSDRLNANDSDSLRMDIREMLDGILDFTYEKVDIVADRFLENPTPAYGNESMTRIDE